MESWHPIKGDPLFWSLCLASPFCDAMEILRRYCSIQLPKEFYDVRLCWLDTFPLSQPLTLKHPSRVQVASPAEELSQTGEDTRQEAQPEDANPAFSAKVNTLGPCFVQQQGLHS